MSHPNQIVSPDPSTSQKGKQKAPPSQPPPDISGESAAEQAESLEPPESRNLSPKEPSFKPFFTLIEDVNSSDHHNPTVHYIFSDDDTDLITEAALRSLEPEGAAPLPSGSYDEDGNDDHDNLHRREPKHSSLPPQIPGVHEHYIVLDMQPSPAATGPPERPKPETIQPLPADTEATTTPQTYNITSSHSLTPTWQVLNTELSPAPTFETSSNNGSDTSDTSQGGLMLKIKGTTGFKPDPARGRDNNNQAQDQNLEEMMDQFEKRMDELRRVIEAGDVGLGVEGNQDEGQEEGGEKVEEVEKGGEEHEEGRNDGDKEGGVEE